MLALCMLGIRFRTSFGNYLLSRCLQNFGKHDLFLSLVSALFFLPLQSLLWPVAPWGTCLDSLQDCAGLKEANIPMASKAHVFASRVRRVGRAVQCSKIDTVSSGSGAAMFYRNSLSTIGQSIDQTKISYTCLGS